MTRSTKTWPILVASLMRVASIFPKVCDEVVSWNGTYTIVNRASLRKISSSSHGFSATTGSIHEEHQWHVVPHGNDAYLIVNAHHGMRILAQASRDQYDGFLTIDHGPIYQDQLWRLVGQNDGSYAVVNVRSGRRIIAHKGLEGGLGFMAVSAIGPFLEEQTWWFINQERDESGPLRQKLRASCDFSKQQVTNSASDEGISEITKKLQAQEANNTNLSIQLDALQSKFQELSNDYSELRTTRVEKPLYEYLTLRYGLASFLSFVATLGISIVIRRHLATHSSLSAAKQLGVCSGKERCVQFSAIGELDDDGKLDVIDGDARGYCAIPRACAREASTMLAMDFPFHISNIDLAGDQARIVKIQCPGVQHADVEINLIWNGCDVTIHRQASLGVLATKWTKRFQFNQEDGHFEFKEDQMQLEHGFLNLVFRAYAFQNRAVRFPQHFSLASTDDDHIWEYSAQEVMPSSPSVQCKRKTKSASLSSWSTTSSQRIVA